ncbi:MAG TPA: hypothetical protein PKZ84_05440 [Anaerolineae bacterium]|nr:hypothetical protein [Anaerolineae bacterium]HQI83705.1 hypothetical protein [Anaerolineae bacterium]
MTEEPKKTQSQTEAPLRVTQGWGQQLVGALIGMLVMGVAMQIGPSFGWTPGDRTFLFLIGGTVGAILFNLDRFAQAGSRLTRRTEGRGVRLTNILVALAGMALATGLVIGLAAFVGWLISLFS